MGMTTTDVLIIGGGPAGYTCALSAQNSYPHKKITLVREDDPAVIPCGIPYILATLDTVDDNILGDQQLIDKQIDIIIDTVTDIDGQTAITAQGKKIRYHKLVLATGSHPVMPSLQGAHLPGVYVIKKNLAFLHQFKKDVDQAHKIAIIGGGFIGFELADELLKLGKEVVIIEKAGHCLCAAFDDEFCKIAEDEMVRLGAQIITDTTVTAIQGDKRVSSIVLADNTTLDVDMVIISIGWKPNVSLAQKMGLQLGDSGAIQVDEYMVAARPNIFAIGDCAEKKDFISRNPLMLMLASTAMAEGRLIGSNLFGLKVIKEFKGTLGTFCTCFGKLSLGQSGLTERAAQRYGFDYVVGTAQVPDRHPGKIGDASMIHIKLLFSRYSHILLGGQVAGGKSTGEITNILSILIQKGYKDMEIDTLQIGTHPLLTPSPISYPIISATVDAILGTHKDGLGSDIH